MRRALVVALPLALAACSTTPQKSQSTAHGTTIAKTSPRTVASSTNARPTSSPYAPAQEDVSKRGQMVGDLYRPDIKDSVPGEIPDVDRIPEPVVKAEPRSRLGNKAYAVLGKNYNVLDDTRGYSETGTASYYGNKFHGRRTSNQEVYDMYAFTAAHRTLPLPSYARVTNLDNGKSVVVRINDRGPFHSDRLIDLSYAAAVKLGYREKGTARVRVDALTPEESSETGQAIALASSPKVAEDYRFDMMQNGKVMTSAEFDAWMKARGLHIATGKPALVPAVTSPPVAVREVASAMPVAAPAVAAGNPAVTLQVASFANQQNAEHALELIRQAGVANARIVEGWSNGRRYWRLRIAALNTTEVPRLTARISGLGFGTPQPVRD